MVLKQKVQSLSNVFIKYFEKLRKHFIHKKIKDQFEENVLLLWNFFSFILIPSVHHFSTMTVLWFLFGKLSLISSQRTLSIITLTTYPLNGFWKILPCSLSTWNFYSRLQFLKINKVFEDYQLFKELYTKRLYRLLVFNPFMYLPVKHKKSKSSNDFQAKGHLSQHETNKILLKCPS